MGITKWAFQRIETRVPVLPIEIKGILTFSEGGCEHKSPFFVWDVSLQGLGIISSDRLMEGEVLKLNFAKPHSFMTLCKVVWCELVPHEADVHETSYRCGLLVAGKEQNFQHFVELVEEARRKEKR